MASRKEEWILGNEEDGVSIWSLGVFVPAFRFGIAQHGRGLPHFIVFEGDHMRWIPHRRWSEKISRTLLRRQIKDSHYLSRVSAHAVATCRVLDNFSKRALSIDYQELPDADLAALFEHHERLIRRILGWGLLPALMDIPRPLLTNHALDLLSQRVQQVGLAESAAYYFGLLTADDADNIQRQEARERKQLAIAINKYPAKKQALLKAHINTFVWAYYGYRGPELTRARLMKELKDDLTHIQSVKAALKQARTESQKVLKDRRSAEQALRLTPAERALFAGMRAAIAMKAARRDAMSFSFYALQSALRELSRRTGTPLRDIQNLAPWEPRQLLSGDLMLKRNLSKRHKICILDGSISRPRVVAGRAAEIFLRKRYKPVVAGLVNELHGQVACVGKAKGAVKIINVAADMRKMKKGDILVSIATTPDIVTAMKKAVAIVTNEGGITSHAAIVSRELNIPCVIGTKVATQVFKDGDIVEVDAIEGIVKKIGSRNLK